jgi:hypothetical protein
MGSRRGRRTPDEIQDLGERVALAALVWNGVRPYAGSELAELSPE